MMFFSQVVSSVDRQMVWTLSVTTSEIILCRSSFGRASSRRGVQSSSVIDLELRSDENVLGNIKNFLEVKMRNVGPWW